VELVPTASGPKAPGVGKETRASLPGKAKQAIARESGSTASSLGTVATSSNYGAPPKSPRKAADDESTLNEPPVRGAFASATASVASVDDKRLMGLLATLLAITVVGVVQAARRARS
jgi:hypothetical protein